MDTPGTDLHNNAYTRLDTMIYVEIENRKETMHTLEFQQDIRGTAACMNRPMRYKIGHVQFTLENTYFYDIWLSGVKTDEEDITEGEYYCGLVKKIHKRFLLDMLKILTKECPGGSYLVMKITPRVTGVITTTAII